MALNVFRLQGVVDIATGSAIDQLKAIGKEGTVSTDLLAKGFAAASAAVPLAVLSALGGILVGLAADAANFGNQAFDAMQKFRVQTLASEDEMKQFSSTLNSLYTVNTDSVNDLAGAISIVRREFGNLGSEMSLYTQVFLDFAKVNGIDTKVAIDKTAEALNAFGLELKDARQLLDEVTVVSKRTGASADALIGALARSGDLFQTFGFSIEESISLLGQFEDQGVSMDVALTGLRQVIRNIESDSSASAEAFKTLGFEIGANGKVAGDAREVFDGLFRKVNEGNLTVAQQAALQQVLGGRASVDMVRGLKAGTAAFEDLVKGAEEAGGTVKELNKTFDTQIGEQLTLIYRKTFGDFVTVAGSSLGNVIGNILSFVNDAITFIQRIGAFWGRVFFGMEQVAGAFKTAVVNVFQLVAGTIADILDKLTSTIDKLPTRLQGPLKGLNDDIKDSAASLRDFNGQVDGKALLASIKNIGETAVNEASNVSKAVKDHLSGATAPDTQTTGALGKSKQGSANNEDTGKSETEEEKQKKLTDAFKDQVRALENKYRTEKLSRAETIKGLQEVLAKYKEQITDKEILFSLEEKIFALRKQGEAEVAKAVEKTSKAQEAAAKDRTQKAEKLKQETEARKALEASLQVELVRLTEGETAGKLKALEKRKADLIKSGQDVLLVERLIAAERKKIEEEANEAITKKTKEAADKKAKATQDLKDSTLIASGKVLEKEISDIRERVEAAKQAGVDQGTISDFLAAKEKEYTDKAIQEMERLAKAKEPKKKGATLGGVYSLDEAANSDFFSIVGGLKGDQQQPAATSEGGKLAYTKGDVSKSFSALKNGLATGNAKDAQVSQNIAANNTDSNSSSPTTGIQNSSKSNEIKPKLDTNQQVSVNISVNGKVEVTEGKMSETTVQGMLGEIGLLSNLYGERSYSQGKGNA